jgi:hypothetical protein
VYGGEGGIRTHGRVSPTLAFEASSFDRSDTSPLGSLANGLWAHNLVRIGAYCEGAYLAVLTVLTVHDSSEYIELVALEEPVRTILTAAARTALVAFLIGGLVCLPAKAAAARAVGMVVVADHAHLGTAGAASGADIFPGDYLDTESGGTLRMKVGLGQMYLLSSSAAVLVQEDQRVVAHLQHGTLGFSTPAPVTLAVQTPLGLVHGVEGEPRVFGQITLLTLGKMQISAYQGTLILDGNDGHKKTIAAGETYEALSGSGGGTPLAGVNGGGPGPVVVAGGIGLAVLLACVTYPESNDSVGCF